MTIWADADSLPVKVRAIIEKRAQKNLEARSKDSFDGFIINAIFVSNKPLKIKQTVACKFVQVDTQSQAADTFIISQCVTHDLIITRDIPFASELLKKNMYVINHKGIEFTTNMIRERLSIRDAMLDIRNQNSVPQSGNNYTEADVKKFSDTFDTVLSKIKRLPSS